MKVKWNLVLPLVLMAVLALTRWPGVMPLNFSATYAIAFCAGLYFPGRSRWLLPLVTLGLTDILLNTLYYHASVFNVYSGIALATYGVIVWLGSRFSPRWSWPLLTLGGVAGAFLFYLITNTVSWLADPAYAKTLGGWLQALTLGRPGYPPTWEFFRNTLISGGLFTGLFAAAMKVTESAESEEPDREKTPEEAPEAEPVAEGGK